MPLYTSTVLNCQNGHIAEPFRQTIGCVTKAVSERIHNSDNKFVLYELIQNVNYNGFRGTYGYCHSKMRPLLLILTRILFRMGDFFHD